MKPGVETDYATAMANFALEKVLAHVAASQEGSSNSFLDQTGILRKSGSLTTRNEAYEEFQKDPEDFFLGDSWQALSKSNNDVVSFLKKVLDNASFSEQARESIKKYKAEGKLKEGFQELIDTLLKKDCLQEAKLLHNVLYLSRQVAEREKTNAMTWQNVCISFLNPKITSWVEPDKIQPSDYIGTLSKEKVFQQVQSSFSTAYPEQDLDWEKLWQQKTEEKAEANAAKKSETIPFLRRLRDTMSDLKKNMFKTTKSPEEQSSFSIGTRKDKTLKKEGNAPFTPAALKKKWDAFQKEEKKNLEKWEQKAEERLKSSFDKEKPKQPPKPKN